MSCILDIWERILYKKGKENQIAKFSFVFARRTIFCIRYYHSVYDITVHVSCWNRRALNFSSESGTSLRFPRTTGISTKGRYLIISLTVAILTWFKIKIKLKFFRTNICTTEENLKYLSDNKKMPNFELKGSENSAFPTLLTWIILPSLSLHLMQAQ